MSVTGASRSVHPQATTAAALALRAQRAEGAEQRTFKTAGDMANFERIAVHGPVPGNVSSEAAQAKAKAKQEKEQAASKARRRDVRANRIPEGIDNKELLTINPEKYSNYALNTAHPRGGNKARVIAKATWLTPVNAYEFGRPQVAMSAAAANPIHLAERASVLGQIEREVKAGAPAERKPTDQHRARMDTKTKLVGPTGRKTVRVQWPYERNNETGELSSAPHLGSIQPSDTSSDEGETT